MHRLLLIPLLTFLLPLFSSATIWHHELAKTLHEHRLVVPVPDSTNAFYKALADAAAEEWTFTPLEFTSEAVTMPAQQLGGRAYLLIDSNCFSSLYTAEYIEAKLLVWDQKVKRHEALAVMKLPVTMDDIAVSLAHHAPMARMVVRYFQHQASWYFHNSESVSAVYRQHESYTYNKAVDPLLQNQRLLVTDALMMAKPDMGEAPLLQSYEFQLETVTTSSLGAAIATSEDACIAVLQFDAIAIYRIEDGRKLGLLNCIPNEKSKRRNGGYGCLDWGGGCVAEDLILEMVCIGLSGGIAAIWDLLDGPNDD